MTLLFCARTRYAFQRDVDGGFARLAEASERVFRRVGCVFAPCLGEIRCAVSDRPENSRTRGSSGWRRRIPSGVHPLVQRRVLGPGMFLLCQGRSPRDVSRDGHHLWALRERLESEPISAGATRGIRGGRARRGWIGRYAPARSDWQGLATRYLRYQTTLPQTVQGL